MNTCQKYNFPNLFSLKAAVLFIIVLALSAADTAAQSGGFAGAYNRMGFGARGMGMGNAYTAVFQEGTYAHYNPALAALTNQTQFDVSVASMSFDRTLNSVNAVFQLPPTAGINIGINQAKVSDFDGRTVSGSPTDTFSTNEMSLFMAFGLRPSNKLSVGFAAKFFYADFFRDVDNQFGFGIDLGLLYRVDHQHSIGFAVMDILSAYTWDASDLYGAQSSPKRTNFPTRFKLGSAYNFIETRLLVSVEFEVRLEQAEIPVIEESQSSTGAPIMRTNRESINTNTILGRIGAVYFLHERLTLRGGWQINDFDYMGDSHIPSVGFSVHLPFDLLSPSIDYTYMREPEGISSMHVFSLRLSL